MYKLNIQYHLIMTKYITTTACLYKFVKKLYMQTSWWCTYYSWS